jgi:hypothetical protein
MNYHCNRFLLATRDCEIVVMCAISETVGCGVVWADAERVPASYNGIMAISEGPNYVRLRWISTDINNTKIACHYNISTVLTMSKIEERSLTCAIISLSDAILLYSPPRWCASKIALKQRGQHLHLQRDQSLRWQYRARCNLA